MDWETKIKTGTDSDRVLDVESFNRKQNRRYFVLALQG
jgi:hypothetical protein